LENLVTQESHGLILHQERAAAKVAEGCGHLAEFLAQSPWEEERTGLGVAQLDIEKHLNSHNHICHQVLQMLEDLPIEAIHTTVATKLQRLHSVIQLSYIHHDDEWPKAYLQPETSTPEFNLVISEIAEFETK
jgi:urease gamma subunit